MSLHRGLFSRIKAATPPFWWMQPVPQPVDDDLAELVDAHRAATGEWRAQMAAAVDEELALALLAFAERMASLGVRKHDAASVVRGLAAVGLAWRSCPEIEHAVVALGVLFDAARRVGDAAALFAEAARRAPREVVPAYADFLTRGDLPQIAAEMGFIEGRDADGFRYYRVW